MWPGTSHWRRPRRRWWSGTRPRPGPRRPRAPLQAAAPARARLLGSARVAPLPVGFSLADLFERRGLHAVGDTALPHPPRLAALRQRGVVQVAVIGQQPHRAALLGPRRVGAELVGSSHLYRVRFAGARRGPGGCRLARPLARRSYGPVPTFPGGHAERRERGFAPSLKAGVPAAHL